MNRPDWTPRDIPASLGGAALDLLRAAGAALDALVVAAQDCWGDGDE